MEFFEEYTKESKSWLDIYKPKKITDIIGNKKSVSMIIQWLNNFEMNKKEYFANQNKKPIKRKKTKKSQTKEEKEEISSITATEVDTEKIDDELDDSPDINITSSYNKKTTDKTPCLLVTGSHGVGKTCSVYAILKSLNYTIQILNFNRIKNNKNIKDIIDRISNKNNIMTILNNKNDKTAIVIDEIESLVSQTEKACIIELIKNNELYWNYPIIFISNNQHTKLLGDIKKILYEIKFWQPFPEDISQLVKKICMKENIRLENPKVMTKLIDFTQQDLRRLILIMQDLKSLHDAKIITNSIIDEYFCLAKKKDTDYDLFFAAKNILFNYEDIDTTQRFYEIDKTAIPLMVQQNYITCINNFGKKNKLKLAKKISNLLSNADIIESFIHCEMNWDINVTHAFFSSIYPSYLLKENLEKTSDRNHNLVYPLDLNKYSIKKINRRNIENVSKVFHNMDITDYIYMNQIVREQIENNELKKCVENFKDYKDFKVEILETIIKVDKIRCSKTNLKSKDKKDITNYLTNNIKVKKIK